ncbi:MAG TPA: alanine--tRNA ligase [Candidatus Paceibacterota bacterium]
MISVHTIRSKYLDFMASKGHVIVPSSSIVPNNDPTTLFTGSGMQPMLPYLLGEKHPMGTRISDSQICFRAEDIEEIGDNRHTTFFEMLGNWSFGEYFKTEQINWMFEFLIQEQGLDPHNLYISCYSGNESLGLPKDNEAAALWKELFASVGITAEISETPTNGMKEGERIFFYGDRKNWWSRVGAPANMPNGEPGGGDTEMFFDFDPTLEKGLHANSEWKDEPCHPNCDCGRFIEIGNNVFMQFIKTENGFEELKNKNVDFGGGLERMTAAINNIADVFETDAFGNGIEVLEKISGTSYHNEQYTKSYRIILDHIRGATFLLGQGVIPSKKDQGYFTRRLIRRVVRYLDVIGAGEGAIKLIAEEIISSFGDYYDFLKTNKESILNELLLEEERFRKVIVKGMKELEHIKDLSHSGMASGALVFELYETHGFPYELTEELLKENGISINKEEFEKAKAAHQEMSRVGGEARFKGGLEDSKEATIKLHTAHHLLLAALQKVLGSHVHQKGSNITEERLRIDFSHPEKVTAEQLKEVEELVNTWIKEGLPMTRHEMKKEEAEKIGAEMEFGAKYPEVVSVYVIGNDIEHAISKEFCGGPHATNTADLGTFKILKEEASSQGVRRIKASLTD